MIILPKYQISPPGNITYDVLVEAAYEGMTLQELADQQNITLRDLHRYIKAVWPRYHKVAQGVRKYREILSKWNTALENMLSGKKPLSKAMLPVKRFVYENLPTYYWVELNGGKISSKAYTWHRPTALVDMNLIKIMIDRPNHDRLVDWTNDRVSAYELWTKLGTSSNDAIDLLIGYPQSKHRRSLGAKALAKMVSEWRPVANVNVVKNKRRYWEERGRSIKTKDK